LVFFFSQKSSYTSREARDLAAFQELEKVEEQRERFGFTGSRKINLFIWADSLLKTKHGGRAQTDEEISTYVSAAIKWKDEKSKPSAAVVATWRSIADMIRKKPEISAVTQRADSKYGRGHIFDELSKFLILCQKGRSSGDTLWLARAALADMIRQEQKNVAENKKVTTPDVMNKAELSAKTGFVAIQQKVRDALTWLSSKFQYQGENSEPGLTGKKIYDHFTDPLKVAEFEEGGFSWMEGYSDSQRKVYNIQKKLMEGGAEVAAVIKGLLGTPPSGGLNHEKHIFEALCLYQQMCQYLISVTAKFIVF